MTLEREAAGECGGVFVRRHVLAHAESSVVQLCKYDDVIREEQRDGEEGEVSV